jgi:hypothetical protein
VGGCSAIRSPLRTEPGYRRCRCRICKRGFKERTGTPYYRLQYPTDIISLVILWRFRYKLSLRDLAKMFLQRGIIFTHEAVRAWENKLAPRLSEALRKRRHGPIANSRFVDETHIRVQGQWCYLYRAMNELLFEESSGARPDEIRAFLRPQSHRNQGFSLHQRRCIHQARVAQFMEIMAAA